MTPSKRSNVAGPWEAWCARVADQILPRRHERHEGQSPSRGDNIGGDMSAKRPPTGFLHGTSPVQLVHLPGCREVARESERC